MKKDLYDQIKTTLKNRKFLSDIMFFQYLIEKMESDNLEHYINNATISDDVSCGYNSYNKYLTFNPKEILWDKKDKSIPDALRMITNTERKKRIVNDANDVNIYNIFTLNHEIGHVLQDSLICGRYKFEDMDDTQKWRVALLEKCSNAYAIDCNFFDEFYYNEYHDYFYNEYDANMYAYFETLRFLESFNLEELNPNIIKLNRIIAMNLCALYENMNNRKKISTPALNFLRMHNQIIQILIMNGYDIENDYFNKYKNVPKPKDEIDRLKLGFSIKKDTHKYLQAVANKKHKTLNIFDDIKTF